MDSLCKLLLGYDGVTFFERIRDGQCVRIVPGTIARFLVDALAMAHDFEEDQKETIGRLEAEIRDLKRSLCLDSKNSHKPPSSDGLRKKKVIKNLREKTERKPGGQPGHEGRTRELHPGADHVQRFEPMRCCKCLRDLKQVPEHEVVRKQSIELKEGRTHITEFQTVIKFCPDCDQWNRGEQPDGFQKSRLVFGPFAKSVALYFMTRQLVPVARTQEILRDLFGLNMSAGTLSRLIHEFGQRLRKWEVQARAQVLGSAVVHADETGIRCEKQTQYVHGYSTAQVTLLALHSKRGLEAMNEIGVLKHYAGHLVHDAFSAYFRFGSSHSLCNAHILRELKFLTEEEGQTWSARMSEFLKSTLRQVHRGRAQLTGQSKRIREKFQQILRQGYRENGYPQEWRNRPPDGYKNAWDPKRGKTIRVPYLKQRAHEPAMKLLNRLRDRQKEILAFALGIPKRRLQAAKIPFTNNQIERDLRMLKLKQKISGCFRSASTGRMFLRIFSFLSTLAKQRIPSIAQIQLVLS